MSRYWLCIILLAISLKIEKSCVRCDCEKGFEILCDNIDDIFQLPSASLKANQVQIGNERDIPHSVLTHAHLNQLNKLVYTKVVIINQLIGLNLSGDAGYFPDSIVLYGNDIPLLSGPMFCTLGNKSLISLQNNGLEKIGRLFAPYSHEIQFVDISRNKLQMIWNIFADVEIEKLDLSHNRLTTIYGSPKGLKVLKLSHNLIESTDSIYLSFSNPTLQVLDLSANQLETVNRNFLADITNLKILNLKSNRLTTFSFSDLIYKQGENYAILLAFNRLRNLDFGGHMDASVMVTLSGNPWNCQCMERMEEQLRRSDSWAKRGKCDDRLAFNSVVPYCVINNCYKEKCPDQKSGIDLEHHFYKLNFSVVAEDPRCDFRDLKTSDVDIHLFCLLYGLDVCYERI